ncbi:flavin-containing monooxygenase [Paenibacillus sp. 1P07SE]|uniref:flavin-containing monooxygenase n=1 Tax=Paenibacillus sp. 1P07SE TaxID=3132209 RepID=UPI0039A60806
MTNVWDVIVIGGGQAGMASGYYLMKNELQFLILEASGQVGGSWPYYYDSLKLFSPASLSSLPGMKIAAESTHYPLRNEVIQYLNDYAKSFHLPIRLNQKVTAIEKSKEGFEIRTGTGDVYLTRTIINASGSFHSPYTPDIKGRDLFQGKVLHSSLYRNTEPFKDQRVVVVGRGNSAVQIAVELSDSSHTTLAVLKPVAFVKQKVLGIDLHYWLRGTGLDTFPFWRLGKKAPAPTAAADLGEYKTKLESGRPDQLQMFSSFDNEGVVWSNGKREKVDTVIFATGYRPSLPFLRPLGALDNDGKPSQTAGVSLTVPGLYFVGLEGQRSFASATLRGVGPDAKFVISKLIKHLKSVKKA